MVIVHVHIERTGGVSLQNIYAKKYHGPDMTWYSVRDTLFAPFNIGPGNFKKDWKLRLHVFIAEKLPMLRKILLKIRTLRRKKHAISPQDLSKKTKLIMGHFTAAQIIPFLPPEQNSYRTVIREPLERTWSHYCYWRKHKGDVGHMVIPVFRENMKFEEFALLPEMHNYQSKAVGDDLSIYEHIGITESLQKFVLNTKLLNPSDLVPSVNHFSSNLPEFSDDFLQLFKKLHAKDYQLYNQIKSQQ